MATYTITCPDADCQSTRTARFGLPIPHTDDYADCVRCLDCGHSWALDPGAGIGCTTCGGSGDIGGISRSGQCPCAAANAAAANA